jgi:hypothetical protein
MDGHGTMIAEYTYPNEDATLITAWHIRGGGGGGG